MEFRESARPPRSFTASSYSHILRSRDFKGISSLAAAGTHRVALDVRREGGRILLSLHA